MLRTYCQHVSKQHAVTCRPGNPVDSFLCRVADMSADMSATRWPDRHMSVVLTLVLTRRHPTLPAKSTFTVGSRNLEQTTMKPMCMWLHGLPSSFSLSFVSYSIGLFTKSTFLWPIHKLPSRWTYTWRFPPVFTPSTGIPRITSISYSPTSTGKSKPVACGTVTLSSSYGRSTSSSHLLTIKSFTVMTSSSLSTLRMESSWDHWTSSYMASSTSYRTSSCPLKIKATLLIMLELLSRNSRTASLSCHNKH